jgi:hypothetical protein
MFPPGNASVADAVAEHRRYKDEWYAEMVGPLLVADKHVTELVSHLGGQDSPLRVGLIATGDPSLARLALDLINNEERLTLVSVDLPPHFGGDGAASKIAELRTLITKDVTGFVEIPVSDARAWLDAIASSPFAAKFRTGGLTAEAFPTGDDLADKIVEARRRAVPFKCTAGLHHAIRHRAPDTGFEHHGFLNILAATAAAEDEQPSEVVARILSERDASNVLDLISKIGSSTRQAFLSFGCCGVSEPIDDLVDLNLLDPTVAV